MRNFRHSKAMASTIRDELAIKGVELSRAESLELIAKAFGLTDWNTLASKMRQATVTPEPPDEGEPEETWPEVARPFYDRHLTPEERSGPWQKLFREAQSLFGAGADAHSDKVLNLALRWLGLASAANGGDLRLLTKYAAAYREALADPRVAPKLPLSRELLDWFGPALTRAAALRGEPI